MKKLTILVIQVKYLKIIISSRIYCVAGTSGCLEDVPGLTIE